MPTATEIYNAGNARSSFDTEWAADRRKIAAAAEGQRAAQLGSSSLNPGDFLLAYDAANQVRMRIGHQSDGSVALIYANGPPPPVPSAPIVAARQLGVYIRWDGTFVGGAARPGDFVRCDVHMSTEPGFTPDGATIVGDLPDKGGTLVGADNVTRYIKLVAVTSSDVASEPTDEESVLPLPATEIASQAIGADQLAANIAMLSRLIVGDPAAGRIEVDSRPGMSPGLRMFAPSGTQTVSFDATTGNAQMTGVISTNSFGARMTLGEGGNTFRFYPDTGNRYTYLESLTTTIAGLDYGVLNIVGPTFTDGATSLLRLRPESIQLYRTDSAGSPYSGVYVDNDRISLIQGNWALLVEQQFTNALNLRNT
ncbi:MAG: hypothetical protein ACOYB2_19515, partial [Limnohabitans sp.]